MFLSGQPIPPDAIPPDFLAKVGPDAPRKLKVMIAKAVVPMPPDQLGVALAVLGSMTLAACVGSLIPLLMERLHIDPAVATGPFVTTAVDIIGILIYFTIAKSIIPL